MPVWLYRFIPSHDYPGWLLQAQILKEYNNPNFDFNRFYEVISVPVPHMASVSIIYLLSFIFPIEFAGKMFLSLYLILFPLSIIYLLRSTQRRSTDLELIGFVFAYNWFFFHGNIDYLFGLALLFLTLGFLWKYLPHFSTKYAFIFGLLSISVYLTHLVAYLVLLLVFAIILIFRFRDVQLSHFRPLVAILPSCILLFVYLITPHPPLGTPSFDFYTKLISMVSTAFLFLRLDPFGNPLPITPLNIALLIGLFLITLLSLQHGPRTFFPQVLNWPLAIAGILLIIFSLIIPSDFLTANIGRFRWPDQRLVYPGILITLAGLRFLESDRKWFLTLSSIALLVLVLHLVEFNWVAPKLETIYDIAESNVPRNEHVVVLHVQETCDPRIALRGSVGAPVPGRIPFYLNLSRGGFNRNVWPTSLLRIKPEMEKMPGTDYLWVDKTRQAMQAAMSNLFPADRYIMVLGCGDGLRWAEETFQSPFALISKTDNALLFKR